MKKSVYGFVISTLFLGSLMIPGGWGCGGATTTAGDGTDDGDGSSTTSTNALAVAFPDDLAVSSITASSSSSSALKAALKAKNVEGDDDTLSPEGFMEKKEEMNSILNATAPEDVQIPPMDFSKGAPPMECFGPQLYWEGTHPDGVDGQSPLPPLDLGLWEETEASTGEACAVAVMNSLIGEIENYINLPIKAVAATLAAANLEGVELPAGGEVKDMTDQANEVLANSGIEGVSDDGGTPDDTSDDAVDTTPIDSATMTRSEENTEEGFPVYMTEIEGTIDMGDQRGEATIETTIEHIPEVTDEELAGLKAEGVLAEETYCGRLNQKISFSESDPMNMNAEGCDGMTECLSVTYCKDSATSLKYHMRRAQFCGQEADCFDANGDVDPSKKYIAENMEPEGGQPPEGNQPPQGNPPQALKAVEDTDGGWFGNFYFVVCEVNPEDGSGSCAQAWQAGPGDALTRVLQVKVNNDGTGCGYYGFGPEVEETNGALDRMVCNWVAPGGAIMTMDYTGVQKAQKQCFTLNEETGLYESNSATLAITYAPTNDCDKTANSFAYGVQNPPTDVPASEAITNNLIDIEDVDFDLPELPVVP